MPVFDSLQLSHAQVISFRKGDAVEYITNCYGKWISRNFTHPQSWNLEENTYGWNADWLKQE